MSHREELGKTQELLGLKGKFEFYWLYKCQAVKVVNTEDGTVIFLTNDDLDFLECCMAKRRGS